MLCDVRSKGGNLLINMGPDPSGKVPFEQERAFRELALWMFINDEAIHGIRPGPIVQEGDIRFTCDADQPGTVYLIIPQGEKRWRRGERREFTISSLRAGSNVAISVLGQSGKAVEYKPGHDAEARVKATDEGIQISVVRAQRIYNNNQWPNSMVVKLQGVEFAEPSK
jgi:alpha-L-fucosidase